MAYSKRPAVLVAEGDEATRKTIGGILSPIYDVIEAEDEEQLTDCLQENPQVSVAIVGSGLSRSPEKLIRDIHKRAETKSLPFVILMNTRDRAACAAAMSAGAADLIFQPFDERAVLNRIGIIEKSGGAEDISKAKMDEAVEKAMDDSQRATTRLKKSFLSTISHEFKTPLNAIINLSFLAEDTLSNHAKTRENLQKIGASGTYLLGIIDEMIEFLMLENREITLQPCLYRHEDFIGYMESTFAPLCREKGLAFRFERTDDYAPIWVDRERFNRIFLHILDNAVKFTKKGGSVTVKEINVKETEKHFACDYYITDTGCGISEEFQKRLFLPYEHEDDMEAGQGTGLGLAITKRLVDLMGGSISIDSRKDEGTTVRIHLMLPKATPSQIGLSGADRAEVAARRKHGRKTVLVVDDNKTCQLVAKRSLEKYGYTCECVGNGRDALERMVTCADGQYAAILMDVRMPVMDGVTAAIAIRSLESPYAQQVPIVAMTANAFDDDIQSCLAGGMNAFLSKPLSPEKMVEILEKLQNK